MKYKLFIISTATLLLISCASPAQLRENDPFLILNSSHNAKAVAACISNKRESFYSIGTTPVNIKLLKDGYSVSIESQSHTGVLADVVDLAEGGSATRYYKFSRFSIASLDDVVISCQQ